MSNKKISDPSVPIATELTGEELIPFALSGAFGAMQPKLFQRGLIKIIDLNEELFTDLGTAKTYIRTYIDELTYSITNESYVNGVFFFTVPIDTEAILTDLFLGHPTNPVTAYIVDELGLIVKFTENAFRNNSGNNYLGNVTFEYPPLAGGGSNDAFHSFTGTVSVGNINIINSVWFARFSTGKFIFRGNIGSTEGVNFTNFFVSSSSSILANAQKYTSNSGVIHGDLQTAITNGCNVLFDGKDKISNSYWEDISLSVTQVGFSSTTLFSVWCIVIGNCAKIFWNISGTSDTNSIVISGFPFTVNPSQPFSYVACAVTNNGSALTTPGRARFNTASNQLIIQRDMSGSTFIAGGTKATSGQIEVML